MKKKISIVLFLVLGFATEIAKADFVFGEPTNLGPTVNSSAHEYDPSMSTDELELYLNSGSYSGREIWVATRASTSDPWSAPVKLGPNVNSPYDDCCPDISADGLSLFFWSSRPGGSGGQDLWVTTRASTSDPWTEAVNLGPTVNSSAWDGGPSISADGLSLFFFSERPGGSGGKDLWVTTRTSVSEPWGAPVNLGPKVNSSAEDATPDISTDGLALFFFSTRSGGYGNYDLWVTTRTTLSSPWGSPVNLGPTVNGSTYDFSPNISADGTTLYYNSGRSGGVGGDDIWQVTISPVVDFNGDGIVDSADMDIMVDHWHTDETLCDIGPMPWGDGIVDAQDMLVLTEYMTNEEVDVDADAIYKEMCDLYTLAVETGDLDLYVDVYTNDAVQIPPDAPIRIGSAQVRAAMEPALASFNIICPIYPQEATVNGNWAFGRCDWSLSLTPKEGGATTTFDGRSIDILKRQPDGSWKFYMSCWNYNGPLTVEE